MVKIWRQLKFGVTKAEHFIGEEIHGRGQGARGPEPSREYIGLVKKDPMNLEAQETAAVDIAVASRRISFEFEISLCVKGK